MNDSFYAVTFANDCSTYYFHNLERARTFILESYDDDCFDYDLQTAAHELNQWNNIKDYAWINVCMFED